LLRDPAVAWYSLLHGPEDVLLLVGENALLLL
jgi:hypothetical protein